jgi:glycyl-tRNA synthetase
MEQIVSLCKRRGFIFPGSEIYGGLANTWDYGPYGVELKNNVKKIWWKTLVQDRDDMVGLDAAILMNPKTWEASGHIESFSDPLMDCKECKERVRGDKILEEKLGVEEVAGKSFEDIASLIKEHQIPCPKCGKCNFTEARSFNLMFKTHQGVLEETAAPVYLRPETAQGIFVNFKNVLNTTRKKLPFGIGQIGKSFRNEITPGNFTFRTREFEQMEIEYFINPKNWEESFEDWKATVEKWYLDLGIKPEKIRTREHDQDELSHYSKRTLDIEYEFPFGWGELFGLAYRTDYDLGQHEKFSGQDLKYFDQESGEKFVPHVIEPSFGCDRTVLTFLIDAYDEDEIGGEKRVVMRLHPKLAPVKVAILPLVKNKEEITNGAKQIHEELKKHFVCEYDEAGTIGKRYRRHDEIGTPYAITFDFDSLEDKKVTLRDRDTATQERVEIAKLAEILADKF